MNIKAAQGKLSAIRENMVTERAETRSRYTLKAIADEAAWIREKFDGSMRKLEDYVDGLEGDDAMTVEAEYAAVDQATNALRSALHKLSEKAKKGPIWKA